MRTLSHLAAMKRRLFRSTLVEWRLSNLRDIVEFMRANPIRLQAEVILISQVHRSGGTLLTRLLDNHPLLAVSPVELKFGRARDRWLRFDPALGPEETFFSLFNGTVLERTRRGIDKGRNKGGPLRFLFSPRVQYAVFKQLWRQQTPANARQLLDYHFTAFFNAWLDYKGRLEEKRAIVVFAPRLAYRDNAGVTEFFASYPEGRLIQIIRDPGNWFPSSLRHRRRKKERQPTPDEQLEMWCASAKSIIRHKENFGNRVTVLRFEDLVGKTENTMRNLAQELGIDFLPTLLQPTYNGAPMMANSSFDVQSTGLIADPLKRDLSLSECERSKIDCRCRSLYDEICTRFVSGADHYAPASL